MKLLIMSDIHGNISALDAALADVKDKKIEACALLGDLIDYGMHSNEVIERIKNLPYPVICNIWGNHESSIMRDEYDRFSSERGRQCAKYTKSVLNKSSLSYLENMEKDGKYVFETERKRFLAVHGSLKDNFWKSIDTDSDFSCYSAYDYVLSGHSHLPHYFEKYYACENPETRNKKKTVFINPGSVGQPRNLNSCSQYAILDTANEEIVLKKVYYDIVKEQQAYNGQVDEFYRIRLTQGI